VIQRHGSARGTLEFERRTVRLHIEGISKIQDARVDLLAGDFTAQVRKLIHLDDFDVAAEKCAWLREIGINIEHAAVVVAHDAEVVVLHLMGHAASIDPTSISIRPAASSLSMPVTWKNGMRERLKTLEISGTEHD
jgi:hypothetical protein